MFDLLWPFQPGSTAPQQYQGRETSQLIPLRRESNRINVQVACSRVGDDTGAKGCIDAEWKRKACASARIAALSQRRWQIASQGNLWHACTPRKLIGRSMLCVLILLLFRSMYCDHSSLIGVSPLLCSHRPSRGKPMMPRISPLKLHAAYL